MGNGYRTDSEKIDFLKKRIQRLELTLERLENLGMNSISSAGSTKSFRQQEEIRRELEVAEREYLIINSRVNGQPENPTFKETVICNRRQY